MQYETATWNGEPSIRVWLDYEEAREFLVLDDEWIEYLDSLTASERDELTLELFLVPLREVAEYAIGTTGKPTEHLPALSHASTIWTEDDYDGCLYSLEEIDRAAYLEVLDRVARIIAREIRACDTEDISRRVDLLKKLDEIADRAGRKAEDYVRMDAIPEPDCYQIRGYAVLEGAAKNFGGTAHVTVPRKYSGKRVKVVVLDP